jgi:RNA polymerase sigma-70 factor (ECF subfamily)
VIADRELLERWHGGDADAGAELFDRHYQAVGRFLRNKVDDGLEDLVQATFMACLEHPERFRGESSFRTYLFSIARNLLHKHYRRLQRGERPRDPMDFERTAIHDVVVRPSELIVQRAEQRMLLEALRRIPLDHQIVLELYFWEPLKAREIAEILDVPVGTVRTRIRRAKALLEEQLRTLASSPAQLESTLTQLDDWARSVRALLSAG